MKESLFKLFGSIRLVQEVSRSTTSSSSNPRTALADSSALPIFQNHPSQQQQSSLPQQTQTSQIRNYHDSSNLTPTSPASNTTKGFHPSIELRHVDHTTSISPSQPKSYRGRQSQYSNVRQHRFPSPSTLPKIVHLDSSHTPLTTDLYLDSSQAATAATTPMKSKSHKLLCLWPLPVMTRYTILVSALISTLNACQVIQLTCSSPKYVLFRLEIINLFLSPFLFNFTLHGLVLFGWNVLILGLFEESLSQSLGSPQRFFKVVSSTFLAVCTLRQGLGYLFSRSTGWALPTLFFSDSIHECNQGLAPFLFALLVIQSISIDDKYILIFGDDEESNYRLTIRKVTLQLAMLLVNYTVKNILWWSLAGLLTGYMATLVIQATFLAREEDLVDQQGMDDEKQADLYRRRIPLWRLLWAALKRGTLVTIITLPLLFVFNAYYTREHFVDDRTLDAALNKDPYLFSFVIMTAPRRGDPPFLSQTLQSYLDAWPLTTTSATTTLYDRIQVFVYTHFTTHAEYDRAHERFSQDAKGLKYIKWVREPGDVWDHRRHISSALQHAGGSSTYVALVEDDFPLCGQHAWSEMKNIIYEANQKVPGHCGVFVGTGGSGLFLKPDIATLVSRLLLQYTDIPPDIVIQKCLRGELDECMPCQQTLVASKTLLMHHIGFNASTSEDRKYKKNEFQCGWRHPFNGDPDVITL